MPKLCFCTTSQPQGLFVVGVKQGQTRPNGDIGKGRLFVLSYVYHVIWFLRHWRSYSFKYVSVANFVCHKWKIQKWFNFEPKTHKNGKLRVFFRKIIKNTWNFMYHLFVWHIGMLGKRESLADVSSTLSICGKRVSYRN